ncbi:MAG: CoA transferase [Alphaproteobacteria bacterium]|nr:CoA transferase [Alphaproteobacteria bacterium]
MTISTNDGPLAGCRVLEIGSIVAGPYCGRLMADFGADVIKLEAPGGDRLRGLGKRYKGKSLFFATIHRNKRNISIDLKSEEGRDLVRRLMLESDVVIENLSPGALDKWGLGYAEMSKVHPRLVMVRISGYGQTGPYADRPGYGIVGEAVSGLRGIIGDPDRPPPRAAVPLTDYITGVHAAYGVMMALYHRERTGRGQEIDATLYESAFSFMESFVPAYEKLGVVPERTGAALPGSAPNNLYPTADGKFVHITSTNDSIFSRLAEAMGRPDLSGDPDWGSDAWRRTHEDEVDAVVGDWTAQHDMAALCDILLAHRVPSGPINTIADVFEDPHFRARDMLVEVPDEDLGSVTLGGVVPKLSETPGGLRHTGHDKGADTRAVLAERLGLTAEVLDRLEADGVILSKGEPPQ